MKPLRLLLIGLSALALLLVVVVALAFSPGVQTWAARKFAPASPDLTIAIGRVDAGLHQTRLENVRVVQPGLVLTVPTLDIEVGVLDAAGGKIEVKRLVAKGWVLDLTAPAAPPANSTGEDSTPSPAKSPEETTREGFEGLFKLLELPADLYVDGIDLAGEVLLPGGAAQVVITGGGLAPGNEGRFALTSDFKSTDATTMGMQGAAIIRMDTPRTFERIELTATLSAKGPQVPQGATLDISATAVRKSQGEDYTAVVRSTQRDIFKVDVTLPPGPAPLTGSWKLDASQVDAVPFMMGKPLPAFVAKGQGTFEADRMFAGIKAEGSLDASVDKLDVLQPEFASLGRLVVTAGFNVVTQGDIVRLNKLDARVTGDQPVASVSALQVLEFNTTTGALTATNTAGEVLRVTLDGVPLAWAKPFLGDLALTGDPMRGAFTASASEGGFQLRPVAPITLTNVSIAQAGAPLVRAVDVSLSVQADYTPKGWTANVTDLSARSGGASLFKVTAKAAQPAGEQQALTASGTFEANLSALLEQPVVAGSAALKQGVARGDFSVTSAVTQQANLTLQLADLVAVDSTPLPVVALQARADIDAGGRIDAKVPILITQAGRRSDLNLEAVVMPGDTTTNIQARLTSDMVHVPDVMALSSISPPAPEPAPSKLEPTKPGQTPGTTEPATKPGEPLWAGVTGELKLALKRLVYAKDLETSLNGSVKITPDALTLENFKGALKTGGTLDATGGLKFEARKKQPYVLNADVALNDVEPAPILRALSPKEQAPVEGKFDLKTQLAGRAIEPAAFTDNVIGDIHLTSKGGTFKALNVKANAVVDTVSTIAGVFGAVTGNNSTAKYADRTRAAADIAKQLGSIKFDQLTLVVARDKKKNMEIKDLTLISPTVHLTGSGQITHVPGVSLLKQPLLVNLQLGAKEKLAADFRTLNLIGNKENKQGYAWMSEKLRLDGSLQDIGTSQISELIRNALTQ